MNKSPVLALVSLFFVASVASFPLNEPTIEGFVNDLPLDQNEELTNYEDLSSNEDLGDDFDIGDNSKIEDFVLGSPSPRTVTTGLCYQGCPKDTVSNCKNVPPNTFKYLTKAQRNYCISLCPVFNKRCT